MIKMDSSVRGNDGPWILLLKNRRFLVATSTTLTHAITMGSLAHALSRLSISALHLFSNVKVLAIAKFAVKLF